MAASPGMYVPPDCRLRHVAGSQSPVPSTNGSSWYESAILMHPETVLKGYVFEEHTFT